MHAITDSVLPTPHTVDIDGPLNVTPDKGDASVANPSGVRGRRRPGRPEQVSPALIPLLREPTRYVDDPGFDSDLLAPARGLVVGLLLSVPLWALVGLGIWFVL
jgi:hypothetical protein